MPAYVEVWKPDGRALIMLETERVSIGRQASNDIAILADASLSRMHAVLERFPSGWCVRDLSSHNGTFLNGERLVGERPLRPGDELRVGQTRLVYRVDEPTEGVDATDGASPPPELTRRERDVLVALCHPLVSGDVFTEPASLRDIAEQLVVTEAAVKQHLQHLYDKFSIYERGERRRVRLANEAMRRGAVTLADFLAKGGGGLERG